MKLVIKIDTIIILSFFIILFKNFYGIVDSKLKVGVFFLTDVYLIIFWIYLLYQFVKYKNIKVEYQYAKYIVLLIIFVVVSAMQEKLLTGQSLFLGISPQRNYLAILLSYFPLKKLMVVKGINIENILESIMKVGSIGSFIYILQKIVHNVYGIDFLFIPSRDDGLVSGYRLYVGSAIIILSILISVYRFLSTHKFKYTIHFLLGIITQVWVTQSRMELISIIFSIVMGLVLFKKISVKKIGYYILLLIGIILLSKIYIFQNIIGNIFGYTSEGDTLTIRRLGRELYFDQLTENVSTILFGTGYPNFNYYPAMIKTGFFDNIFLSDNGIFSYIYIYGIICGIVFCSMIIKYMSQSVYCAIGQKNTVFFMYGIVNIIMGYTIILWYWYIEATYILILMICILEVNYVKLKEV